jgi:CO/xanthine dehydrogenase FAD-binding subunit
MKPAPFEYFAPRSLPEALELLNRYGDDARLLAGGQSLIASLNFRCLRPKALIDLNRVAGLDGLAQQPDGTLLIGALNRHRTLEFDPLVERAAPLLHEAAPYIAHPPTQATRYFRVGHLPSAPG